MIPTILVLWATYVLSAFLWTGLVVGVLALIVLALGLCRRAADGDAKAAP